MEKDGLELEYPARAKYGLGTQQQRHDSNGKTAIHWKPKKDRGRRTNDSDRSFCRSKNTGAKRDSKKGTGDTGGEGTVLQKVGPRTSNYDM